MRLTDAERAKHRARVDADMAALNAFRAAAKKAKPTRQHRQALWECMLGTVYACNAKGKVEYFDYDYAKAIAFIGPFEDVRCHREAGKWVWWVKDKEAK